MGNEENSLKGMKPGGHTQPVTRHHPNQQSKPSRTDEIPQNNNPHPARSTTVTSKPLSPEVTGSGYKEENSLRRSRSKSKSPSGVSGYGSGGYGYGKKHHNGHGHRGRGYSNGYGYYSGRRSYSLSLDERNSKKDVDQIIMRDSKSMDSCFLSSLLASILIVICLFSLTIYVYNNDSSDDKEIIRSIPYSNQMVRKRLAILSENFDCSVFTKQKVIARHYGEHLANLVTMCLHVTEPHSVAPDSAISFMYSVKQGMKQRVYAYGRGLETKLAPGTCDFGNSSNVKCSQQSMDSCLNAYVQLEGDIAAGDLKSAMYWDGIKTYNELYRFVFPQIFGSSDAGLHEFDDAMYTEHYNRKNKNASVLQDEDKFVQSFVVSRLFRHFAKNMQMSPHVQSFSNITIGKDSMVTFNRKITRFLMEKFLNQKTVRKVAVDGTEHVSLIKNADDFREGRKLTIEVPKGPTLSIVSAFIVKVVYDVLKMKELDVTKREETMYTMVALSHKVAISILPETSDWTGFGEHKSLLERAEEVIHIFRETKIGNLHEAVEKYFKGPKVKRSHWDRVVSVLVWLINQSTVLQMQNTGLPRMFYSKYYDKPRGTTAPFRAGKMKSQPFMSSAGLFIKEHQSDEQKTKVIYAVTSSGSVRTVDAVAIPILRMLLLNETPEKAVYAPAVYYDPIIADIVCEGDDAVDHPEFAEHAERIRSALVENGVNCSLVNRQYPSSTDRTSFAMHRDLDNGNIYAAVDPRHIDKHNYAAGY